MEKILFGAGRIGRLNYFLGSVGLSVAYTLYWFATSSVDADTGARTATANTFLGWLVLVWLSMALTMRRIHDRNHTGWFVWLFFFPIINVVSWLYLLFAPSYDTPNRHGRPAESRIKMSDEQRLQLLAIHEAELARADDVRNAQFTKEDGSFDFGGLVRPPETGTWTGAVPDATEPGANPGPSSTLPPPPGPPPR